MNTAQPPGPKGLPIVGVVPRFSRDPLAFLDSVHAEYGDVVHARFFHLPIYWFFHPDHVEEVLMKQSQHLIKDQIYEVMRPLLGNGLVTSENPDWKRNRRIAAPSFTPRQLAAYGDEMVRITQQYTTSLRDGDVRDLHEDLMRVTMEIVLGTIFGSDATVDHALVERTVSQYMDYFQVDGNGWGALVPPWVPLPHRRRIRRAIAQLDEQVLPLIRARREAAEKGDDLLGRLLAAQDEDGEGMSDQQLRDEVITLFTAGHETTALALTYALVLLSDTPSAREPLVAEVRSVLGDRPATMDDLSALPYTRAVIQEAMRLRCPTWAVGREATSDIEVAGYTVPKGSQIMLCQWVNHRDGRYFDDPLAFKPERWLDGLEKRLPRFAYFPFGGGPRVCIGNHFAMMEAMLVLATLTQHATFDRLDEPLRTLASITMRPRDPVRFTVHTA